MAHIRRFNLLGQICSAEKKGVSMRSLFIITSTLPATHGGRTASLLHRARLLSDDLKQSLSILTTNYNNRYDAVIKKFRDIGKFNAYMQHINIYDDLMGCKKASKKKNYRIILKSIGIDWPTIDQHLYHQLQSVSVAKQKNNQNKIQFLEFMFLEGVSVKFSLDTDENVHMIRYSITHSDGTVELLFDEFYDRDGHKYIQKQYVFKNGQSKFANLLYVNGFYQEFKFFTLERDFFLYWYQKIIPENSTVINDAMLLDRALILLDTANIKKIFQLHSSHLSNPSDSHSDTKGSFKYLLSHLDRVDTVVTLTNKQKQNILEKVDKVYSDKFSVIPHAVKSLPVLDLNRARANIVFVGRLAAEKRVSHIILAFQKILEDVPDAQLHIYGDGAERVNLEHMVQGDLVKRVFFHGHIDDVDSVFQSAKCSVLTSELEGFALSVQESLANGCPVVSYDINYGPSDMILDGVNGFLVPFDDVEQLSVRIKQIITDEIVFEPQAVQSSVSKFKQDIFIQRWRELCV
ncbi:MAG: glycosyltransferase [Burkholderiales bacterium]|nr:glycosyltransferase [Burkholderiales bacterium]